MRKKPKIILDSSETDLLNANFGKEAYEELKQIKEAGELNEFGFDIRLPSYFTKVKAGDIISLIWPELEITCSVKTSILYESGRQSLELRYEDVVFKK